MQTYPVVAYAVDTAGVIESLAFLNSPPVEFRRAICDWSRIARFEPLFVLGRVRRGLVVTAFAFHFGNSPFPPSRPPDESLSWRSKIADMPSSELSSLLESRPHC